MKVVVIGGGASGLIAAITLKEMGTDVTLIERNPKLGRKILATGNGRCNFMNVDATEYQYNHPYFVKPVFEQMSPEKTLHYFENLGITARIEDLGKTYPFSEQASSIVDVLVFEIERLGVHVIFDAKVVDLKKNQDFEITLENGEVLHADKVILATGGKAMPRSGSDGLGYTLAESFGHTLTTLFPALTKLELNSPHLKQMDGVKIQGTVELLHYGNTLQVEQGDVLFTKYGISGPTILQISRKANELLSQDQEAEIKVILVEHLDRRELSKRFQVLEHKTAYFSLIGLVHKKLILPLLSDANIHPESLLKDVPKPQMNRLIHLLYDWRFKVTGSKDFDDAQVTAGGINIQDVNPQTLESKLVAGLFFCGEILDIDGICGGYNLQWAWSSGYVAAKFASRK
ncbi:MAG: NAD(P)/FAD-dependent oxidoreductase [Acholeplasma sp.]|jgi:predicted Rossmann fold flavoprotein|nr:MAG: NAD(P)/FAD-dependent oxidoreductase [Acholeplasma sp.]